MIEESATTDSCSKSFVYKWQERFSKGRTSVKNDPRQGRPATVKTSILDVVRDVVNADWRNLCDVVFHQDNAPAHRAAPTMLDISLLEFEVLEHPPYSPDLAPMDFRVFPEMKACLGNSTAFRSYAAPPGMQLDHFHLTGT